MKLYRNGGTYVYLTNQSPKGFAGVLFVAYEGPGPGAMQEVVVPPEKIKGWEEVPLTNTWREEFGLPPVAGSTTHKRKRRRKRRRTHNRALCAPAQPAPEPPPTPADSMSGSDKWFWSTVISMVGMTVIAPMIVSCAINAERQGRDELERQVIEEKVRQFSEETFDFTEPECMIEV